MRSSAKRALLIVGFIAIVSLVYGQSQKDESFGDEDVSVTTFQDLQYPPLARAAGIQGVVVVRVNLGDDGKVLEAVPLSGGKILIPDVIANVKTWRFQPTPRRTAVVVYNFRLILGDCSPVSQFILQIHNQAIITSCFVQVDHGA